MLQRVQIIPARFGAIAKVEDKSNLGKVGGRGVDLEGKIPDKANWPAHNHSHLHEQPTLFYAVVIMIHTSGATSTLFLGLAWAFVAARFVHAVIHLTINHVLYRFMAFAIGVSILLAMWVLLLVRLLAA